MRSIGCCYLFRQIAGSEQLGGLQVTLRPRSGQVGQITFSLTHYYPKRPLESIDDALAQSAIKGIHDIAAEHGIQLDDFDIELSNFLYHDVDSSPHLYHQAAKSAFRSAWEAWAINRR